MNSDTSWLQTILAAVLSVVGFFVLLYVVAPIAEALLNVFGKVFVPERFGGGSEVDNPGILTLAVRAILASGLSAWVAFAGTFRLFERARTKTVAVVFAVAVIAWAGFFAYPAFASGSGWPLVIIVLGAVPALFVAYWAWQCELWRF